MYFFRCDTMSINALLDGRTILFLAKDLSLNRGVLSEILHGKVGCKYEYAKRLVDRVRPGESVEYYFILKEDGR